MKGEDKMINEEIEEMMVDNMLRHMILLREEMNYQMKEQISHLINFEKESIITRPNYGVMKLNYDVIDYYLFEFFDLGKKVMELKSKKIEAGNINE